MDQWTVFFHGETVGFCLNAPAGPTYSTPGLCSCVLLIVGASVGGIDSGVNRGGGGRLGDGDTRCLTPQLTLQLLPWERFISSVTMSLQSGGGQAIDQGEGSMAEIA
jgi:hypothetical protein